MTPFVRFGLLYRAVELTGNLGVCRIQESSPGDRKYDEGVVFLMSAMEDAKIYTTEAPQRCKIHEERVILGPETPADLKELQLHLTQQNILKRYPTAVQEWNDLIARFDEVMTDERPISLEQAEYDLAAWLDELHLDHGEEDEPYPQRCSHPRMFMVKQSQCCTEEVQWLRKSEVLRYWMPTSENL
ncbi:uncharacterized protein F5891DRAFT_986117 [Suillus fuscotomentosus]|uniref:Uncharacterized protein n=1 Tax=Suillus fuscotomentosus TaxID=1912939 RepID=A0AAD4DSV4_9AGAM|nr:uncharacterized protein F5891DRAFT_986117 [Suillus fuscotomentosus]KAG1893206.1 hypothetical protein F5891DRAFT_986117 [Suillus fuscotomentosus]